MGGWCFVTGVAGSWANPLGYVVRPMVTRAIRRCLMSQEMPTDAITQAVVVDGA